MGFRIGDGMTTSTHTNHHTNSIYAANPNTVSRKRGGAEEACWAHNPEVGGSKPLSANLFLNFNF